MKLTRGRTIKVNLGNYESDELMAVISVDGLDLFTEEELAEMDPRDLHAALKEFCEEYLADNLEPALRGAAEVSQAKDSILFEPPARRERTTRRSTR